MAPQDTARDGLVAFLPHRLNRQPVVVRGLTADELWVCAGLSAAAGLLAGLPLAWITRSIAMMPTMIVLGVAAGVFVGGGLLRRKKRGRPDIWLYRQMQWRLALRFRTGRTARHPSSGDAQRVLDDTPHAAAGPAMSCHP